MVSKVQHLCNRSRTSDQDLGRDASVQRWGPVRKDSHRCNTALATEGPRKPIPPDRYGLLNQVAGSLRHSQSRGFDGGGSASYQLFCCLEVPRELHSDQGRNFLSRLIQEVFQRLGVSKTRTTAQHSHSNGMVERHIKTVEDHLLKVVVSHLRDWNARLPNFLLLTGHPLTTLLP
jgi:transposase InsO family protein